MQTVGQILKERREVKLYSLEEVEKHTKIRIELLEALEADDYSKLPPPTFIQGFIKNYGRFLGLNPENLLAVFRRDFEAKKHPPVVLKSFSNPLKSRTFRLTTSKVLALTISVIILIFFSYLWFQYRQFVGAPNLELTSPYDQQTVDSPNVLVEGKTDPEVKVVVNNQEVSTDKDGRFSQDIKLLSSSNTITVVGIGRFGQSTKIERVVFVKK